MKRIISFIILVTLAASCNDNGSTPGQKLDTLLNRADTVADRIGDSVKAGAKELKEDVKDVLDRDKDQAPGRTDSIKKDTTIVKNTATH